MNLLQRLLVGLALTGLVACDPQLAQPQPSGGHAAPPRPAPVERCINLSNALEAPLEGEWGYRIEDIHLREIARAGFDTVRLPVKWSAHTGPRSPYTIDPALLARVDHVVDTATALGLNVIVDVHHFDELYSDPAGEIGRLRSIWSQLSRHYAEAPESVMFELINEPRDEIGVAEIERINRDLLDLIRIDNPRRWVILGSAEWGGLDAWARTRWPDDPRIMTTFHYYEPWNFTHEGASWLESPPSFKPVWGSRPEHLREVEAHFDLARAAAAGGPPVLLGEFGAYYGIDMAERAAWIDAVRNEAEDSGFGWCHWGFASSFRAFDPVAGRWEPEILTALGLPAR